MREIYHSYWDSRVVNMDLHRLLFSFVRLEYPVKKIIFIVVRLEYLVGKILFSVVRVECIVDNFFFIYKMLEIKIPFYVLYECQIIFVHFSSIGIAPYSL